MRKNWNTVLVGWEGLVVLVPYRPRYVGKYHAWMQDPELLRQTASEALSLEEEEENCASWRDDDRKLTFIILARELCFKEKDPFPVEAMIGDVNLFLNEDGAECDVMIAESRRRRGGRGAAAVRLLLAYASDLAVSCFYAKIHETNEPSRQLFLSLGFEHESYAKAFGERRYVRAGAFPLEATPAAYEKGDFFVPHRWSTEKGNAVFVLYYGAKAAFVWVGKQDDDDHRAAVLGRHLALSAPALFEHATPASTSILGAEGTGLAQRLSRRSGRLVLVAAPDDLPPSLEAAIASRLLPIGVSPAAAC